MIINLILFFAFFKAESMFAMEKIQNYKRDFESKYEKLAYEVRLDYEDKNFLFIIK